MFSRVLSICLAVFLIADAKVFAQEIVTRAGALNGVKNSDACQFSAINETDDDVVTKTPFTSTVNKSTNNSVGATNSSSSVDLTVASLSISASATFNDLGDCQNAANGFLSAGAQARFLSPIKFIRSTPTTSPITATANISSSGDGSSNSCFIFGAQESGATPRVTSPNGPFTKTFEWPANADSEINAGIAFRCQVGGTPLHPFNSSRSNSINIQISIALPAGVTCESPTGFAGCSLPNDGGTPQDDEEEEPEEESLVSIKILTPRFLQISDSKRYQRRINEVINREIKFLQSNEPEFSSVNFSIKAISAHFPIVEYSREIIDEYAFLTADDVFNFPDNLNRAWWIGAKGGTALRTALIADAINISVTALAAAHSNYVPSKKEIDALVESIEGDVSDGNSVMVVAYSTSTQVANQAYDRIQPSLKGKVRLVFIAGTAMRLADPVGWYTTERDDEFVRKIFGLRWNTDNTGNTFTRLFLLDLVGHDLEKFYTWEGAQTMVGLDGIRGNMRDALRNAARDL